ncbi:hypothetical protein COCSUDRAFT_62245 [Coccomyxa subellipsoidea C-169]|uniref:Uncharacterized protein n=1 Tax=Coccomyxa subellipsoidea (strain C-169) TaxID=574566 RepID=I0Z2H0_COCSC|nr:hypothetical protein COCSUDRAFT_62245 [Coccomyxa subellipsoidea C-169]EIE24839.1 hypothetical protein COCSUDRAFT_62245 [Coccomyxa subellipsoidea C-169]|eukprot:XP_005649383.1 hypothetical protein COCSUDRAFT_62245 [Coccomyxa subellipsoidea C-169]
MSAPENESLNEAAAIKNRRKAPLPRFALKPSIYEQAEQLWQDTIEALLLAQAAAEKIKKHEPEAAAATAQAVPAHADAWRERQGAAHQQGPVPPEMAKYAQMLAGRHWRPPQASDDAAAAAGGATGAAGGRASIAGAQRNAWQRASMVAGEHRALGMARQSIALASSSAAASPANAHAAAQHSDHTAPAANGARQPSYTEPLIIHIGGGPKVIRRELHEQQLAAAALEDRRSSVQR